VVEGVTEFLPISSTGHLLITERLLDVGTTEATKDAADTYTIAIQAGAILAVLVLYRRRLWSMVEGLVGRSEEGRQVLVAVVVAFLPAALVGVVLEKKIKSVLLAPVPIIVAWAVGGALLLVFAHRWDRSHEGDPLGGITLRQAAIIGVVQCLALWPGTSRSLVTIVAALAVGLALPAAVEFSFLLGFVTLGAATAYDLVRNGDELFNTYGFGPPAVGLVVAFISAAAAITWMVGYLQRHSLAVFGWYRLAVAGTALVLVVTSVI
jgi:undecaprenyl-diphosphatase